MHHSFDLPDDLKELALREQLGATGAFPDGKIHETDEGEIALGVYSDEKLQLVHLNFGEKPVAYVSMQPQEAVEVAQALIKHARNISKTPITVEIH